MEFGTVDSILARLNPAQQEAVQTVEGPVLVVAGAGSGKTRVITYRIPYLLLTGAATPENILALTFTNKAAGEMKARTQQLAGKGVRPPLISTFHSFGALFLRRHIAALGYRRDFLICDEDDQLDQVRDCCRELNLNENRYAARDLQRFIQWQKSRNSAAEIYDPNMHNLFELYARKLKASNAVDFDDLLILPLQILSHQPEILQRYRDIYRFIMVDEYQDTNEVQYELLKLLAGPAPNLLVVGDEDQSIYKFRGARSENIQFFIRDFPSLKLIKLEQNYRSTKTIIKAAQAVISRNSARIKKELWTENQPGEPIEVYQAVDEYDEAAYVTLRVMAALKQASPDEIAVLYRANAQSRALEESFVRAQIPHRIVGAVGFYERREVKDAIAYLRLLVNPEDDLSFQRVVNVPPRGIGKKMMEQIQQLAGEQRLSLFEAAKRIPTRAVASFVSLFEGAVLQSSTFLESTLERIGYKDYLVKDDPGSADERWENVQEFLAHLRESEAQPDFSAAAFLGDLPLLSGAQKESGQAVTLLTVHSAKGLEFRHLFVAGMEEGLFPHIRSMQAADDIEEERRLFYVAMTRAKEKLTLSWAQKRGMFGASLSNRPSRFLEEIPAWFKVARLSERFSAPAMRASASASAREETPGCEFPVGCVVNHPTLGSGTVVAVEGVPNDWKLTIRFRDGVKKIMTRYAHLTRER